MLTSMPDNQQAPDAPAKKAAYDDMPWLTAGRAPEQEDVAPDQSYKAYLRDMLGADLRRSRFFDVAGGTRTPGILGALGAGGRSTLVGQELMSAGINPLSKKTPEGFANAFKEHFGDRSNVENLFGSSMDPTEALATLGPMGVLTAARDAGDPASWAKAFGRGAKTPAEQQAMRRRLHAALSLHATKQSLKNLWNTTRLGEVFGKTPFDVISRYPQAHKGWEVGPEGWQPKPTSAASIPVLDPKYFPDNEEAARVAAKYGSFDKYARDLNGDWPTAKDPNDKETHLYHTAKKDGKVVGMVKVKPYIDGFQISNLWIRPEARSGGVGTGLMQRVIKYYGDKKLYLTAEIFDNSPLTQDELENWYKKFGFVGSHEGKMSRPANTKTAAEVPTWAKKNPKLLKALAKKLKKTAEEEKSFKPDIDKSMLIALQLMGVDLEQKPPRSSKKPKRTPQIREVLRKQAAEKTAAWLLGKLRHAAGVIGRGASMAGREVTPGVARIPAAYAGAPNPAKGVWDVLSGSAGRNLAWRQSYLNKLQHGIPKDVRKAEGAMQALQRARDPKVRQHILRNLNQHRVDLENQRYLAGGMASTQAAQLKHYGRLDPSLQQYAHPGVPGVNKPLRMHQVEGQWARPHTPVSPRTTTQSLSTTRTI